MESGARVLEDGQPGGLRYELLRRLGGGGSGDVHLAETVGDGVGRRVCIKRPRAIDAERLAQAEALRREARLLARVRHANVVSVLALAEDPRAGPFLVLELVDGPDLGSLVAALRPDRLADGVAVHVVCGVLRGLSAAQRAVPGLVHRDVSPRNVLVSAQGEVKLADFGIARVAQEAASTEWTRPLRTWGTPGYMAPEQLAGEDLDGRADLFATGVLLYELLVGERPWGPRRGPEELRAVVDLPPVPLLDRRPGLSPSLARAVERLIARPPGRRFAGPDDAVRALAPFSAGELGPLRLASILRALLAAAVH